ncbi:hypothetical protein [Streptomyces sp. OS603R]|uniref:hypothetical protein n=1 Tax=Streptomyces sp. OS603R TaxID=3035287 RepID=UPI0024360A6E|nr:hypothetical protein [Streptomyces sp. OS603R]
MHDLIRRLAHWLGLLGPGTGTHRAGDLRPAYLTADPAPTTDSVCLPLHRSPYCLHLPLDGTDSRLVRPYLTAHEQERARQRRHRRVTLVLAADFGIDLGQHLLGAGKVAA